MRPVGLQAEAEPARSMTVAMNVQLGCKRPPAAAARRQMLHWITSLAQPACCNSSVSAKSTSYPVPPPVRRRRVWQRCVAAGPGAGAARSVPQAGQDGTNSAAGLYGIPGLCEADDWLQLMAQIAAVCSERVSQDHEQGATRAAALVHAALLPATHAASFHPDLRHREAAELAADSLRDMMAALQQQDDHDQHAGNGGDAGGCRSGKQGRNYERVEEESEVCQEEDEGDMDTAMARVALRAALLERQAALVELGEALLSDNRGAPVLLLHAQHDAGAATPSLLQQLPVAPFTPQAAARCTWSPSQPADLWFGCASITGTDGSRSGSENDGALSSGGAIALQHLLCAIDPDAQQEQQQVHASCQRLWGWPGPEVTGSPIPVGPCKRVPCSDGVSEGEVDIGPAAWLTPAAFDSLAKWRREAMQGRQLRHAN